MPDRTAGFEAQAGAAKIKRRTAAKKVVGWTKEREGRFFDAVAETCNVSLAARRAGVSVASAYARRRRHAGFAQRWEIAVDEAIMTLSMAIAERGLNGVRDEPGTGTKGVRKFNEAAALGLIKIHHEARTRRALAQAGAGGGGEVMGVVEVEALRGELLARLERLAAGCEVRAGASE